ncbi:hypothetical protein THAOC_01525 [Thalassiosira oceanica]|uniref:Reverse transcriptase Ty1/copia-type domain-containing protein n=1 Tax=Thalassiosira oceanica TaxID=159749 RepID=K0TN08_THAOC|nr:hypothetical protein THAOC_01525 [Thalassiosira oceanica]|eukprot:EJK76701.1 hypothetical protein THAOC_01525 [Thalassiosira oceanica]
MPLGFRKPGKVLKLKKTLDGLRQSPRMFWKYLTNAMSACDMEVSKIDPCLFVGDKVIAICYVDDILFWSTDAHEARSPPPVFGPPTPPVADPLRTGKWHDDVHPSLEELSKRVKDHVGETGTIAFSKARKACNMSWQDFPQCNVTNDNGRKKSMS